jgi:biopolymer transport protein ExbD
MGLKKKSKVSAQFSMSSLTDIIFLLLIFFMLTSSLVAPNALNLKLPGRRDSQSIPSTQRLDDVRISSSGQLFFNNKRIDAGTLETELGQRAEGAGRREYTITISPDRGAPVEAVVTVMDIAMRYHINGVLAAEE